MKRSFLYLVALFTVSSLYGQFQTGNSPTTQDLHDLWFIDQHHGVAVGDSGTIVRSTDGGQNWTLVMSNDTVSFQKVKFFNAQTGIAIGSHIYISKDTGRSWTNIPHSNDHFYDLEITDQNTCLISGHPTALIRSTDAGNSFTDLIAGPNADLGLLSFVSKQVGYACGLKQGGNSPTLKTTNGGISWHTIPSAPNVNTIMEAMSFVSESVGFKGGWYNGYLQKTTDSAQVWNNVNFQDSTAQGQLLDFHIEPNLPHSFFACGWYGQIFKSTDGGNNWVSLNSGLSNAVSLYGIYFISDSLGWAVGSNGTIIRTSSGGQSIGQPELESSRMISVFPNPSKKWLTIEAPDQIEISAIDIYSPDQQHVIKPKYHRRIDLGTLPAGLYFVKVKTKQGVFIERIVKE